jgi:hypothetical protein
MFCSYFIIDEGLTDGGKIFYDGLRWLSHLKGVGVFFLNFLFSLEEYAVVKFTLMLRP